MKKTLLQGSVTILLFLALWFIMSRIDWMSLFRIEQNTKKLDEKLGELFWDFFKRSHTEIEDKVVVNAIDSILTEICKSNHIDRNKIRLHILDNDEINAFALPDGHLVIFSELITECVSEEELSGAIAHELAHIELGHIMNKLVKEIGLSVLISTTTSGSTPEITREAVKILSSTAYDRTLETEADLKATEMLMKTGIDPAPYADLLYRISDISGKVSEHLSWINSHPESKKRAEEVISSIGTNPATYRKIIRPETWNLVKNKIKEKS
jgi:predicted Zn-dependent protease